MILATSHPLLAKSFIFMLGLVMGSFANVVIARLPLEQSIAKPRSHCPNCKAFIKPWDNIPLLSYFLLRGKCRHCKVGISIRYPIVEFITGFLFLAAFIRYGLSEVLFLRDLPILVGLVALTFIDLDHRIIPDEISLGGWLLCLATSFLDPSLGFLSSIGGSVFGFGFFYAFAWLYQWKTGKSGLGGGDIKLLGLVGAFLGVMGVLTTIMISSIAGSFIGIIWGIVKKEKSLLGIAIPYGPFMVIGIVYAYFFGGLPWFQFMNPT